MSPLWELTKSRLRETYREPAVLFWVFGFPVLIAIGLGIAFRNRPPQQPRIAVLRAHSAPWLLEAIQDHPNLQVEVLEEPQALEALRTTRLDVLAFTDAKGRIVYRYDHSRPESRQARLQLDDTLQRKLGRRDAREVREETFEELGGRYIDFLIPGLLGLNLMSSSLWGIGYATVLARKRRLLKRMAASAMRRSHYMLSSVASRVVFLAAEVCFLLLAGYFIFDVPVRGSLIAVMGVSLLGAASFGAVGLMIAARIESVEVASGLINLVMMPMWLLSGAFFSYERFPEVTHLFIRGLPLTALNDALRTLMLRGGSIFDLTIEMTVLGVWGLASGVIALKAFRWK